MDRMRAAMAVVLVMGCGGTPSSPKATTPEATAEPAAVDDKAASPGLPDGYITMFALGMLRIDATSGAVILSDEQRTVYLPIFIGGTESTSITHRLKGEPFVRPLTHDLVDSLLAELGAELAQVQVDSLRDSTYIGSIIIRDGARVFRLDARPSDAIALATGNAIPIYVSESVVTSHGVKSDSPAAAPYKAAVFGRTATSEDLALEIEKIADKACACADAACLQAVQIELLNLVENAPEPSAGDRAKIMESVQRMSECIDNLSKPSP